MKSIAQNDHQDKVMSASICRFFKTYHIGSILKTANAYKSKGISAVSVFMVLFSAIFLHRSMYMSLLMGKGVKGFGKDTAYRFMKSAHINWIHFTLLLSARIASEIN